MLRERRDDPFARCHPLVNFAFFVVVLGVSMFCLHPFILAISYLSATLYAAALKGWRHVARLNALFIVPGMLVVAIINPTFNHNGVTLLYTLENGNSITLEAIVYGLVLAGTLAVTISWFVSVNAVLTRDKFVYALGRLFPTGALILSMSFRFIPLFARHYKATVTSQKYLGADAGRGRWWKKMRVALAVTSSLFSWSMENAVHVSDSMRARAYGRHRRISYTPYRWDARNVALLLGILVLGSLTIAAGVSGGLEAQYNPVIVVSSVMGVSAGVGAGAGAAVTAAVWTGVGTAAFAILANIPLMLRVEDAVRWRRYERGGIAGNPVPYIRQAPRVQSVPQQKER